MPFRTITKFRIPDTDIDFTVNGPTPDYPQDVDIRVLADGDFAGHYLVSWLVQDPDVDWEWEDIDSSEPINWSSCGWREFSRDSCQRGHAIVDLLGHHEPTHIFTVERLEHGSVLFYGHALEVIDPQLHLEEYGEVDEDALADTYEDAIGSCDAILVVPPDATDPERYATSTLEEYTNWANGDTWGAIHYVVSHEGDVLDESAIWGLIGSEYAEETMKRGDYAP